MIIRNRIILVITAICFLVASCNDSVKKAMIGTWSIDTLYYRNYEIRTCLLGSWLEFKKDGSMTLPVPESRCSELVIEYNANGNWEILQHGKPPLFLSIDSKNMIFGGKHQIVFRLDEANGLLMMEIKSDSLYVLCRKGFFDYDRNQKLIAELEKITGGTPLVRLQPSSAKIENKYDNWPDDTLFLETGWYYVESNGLKRKLDRSEKVYLINPEPIVTSQNVVSFEIYEENSPGKPLGLMMQLDSEGAEQWSLATGKAVSRQLAFVLDNQLLHVATVNSQINGGITALNRGIYTRQELERIRSEIQSDH